MKKVLEELYLKLSNLKNASIATKGGDLFIIVDSCCFQKNIDYKNISIPDILESLFNNNPHNNERFLILLQFLKENPDVILEIKAFNDDDTSACINEFFDKAGHYQPVYAAICVKNGNIYLPEIVEESDEKFHYSVMFADELETTGIITLTKKEAAILNYYTNKNNWNNLKEEDYSGRFVIDIQNPISSSIPIDEVKNRWNRN